MWHLRGRWSQGRTLDGTPTVNPGDAPTRTPQHQNNNPTTPNPRDFSTSFCAQTKWVKTVAKLLSSSGKSDADHTGRQVRSQLGRHVGRQVRGQGSNSSRRNADRRQATGETSGEARQQRFFLGTLLGSEAVALQLLQKPLAAVVSLVVQLAALLSASTEV